MYMASVEMASLSSSIDFSSQYLCILILMYFLRRNMHRICRHLPTGHPAPFSMVWEAMTEVAFPVFLCVCVFFLKLSHKFNKAKQKFRCSLLFLTYDNKEQIQNEIIFRLKQRTCFSDRASAWENICSTHGKPLSMANEIIIIHFINL